jgi:hypothetical protein
MMNAHDGFDKPSFAFFPVITTGGHIEDAKPKEELAGCGGGPGSLAGHAPGAREPEAPFGPL